MIDWFEGIPLYVTMIQTLLPFFVRCRSLPRRQHLPRVVWTVSGTGNLPASVVSPVSSATPSCGRRGGVSGWYRRSSKLCTCLTAPKSSLRIRQTKRRWRTHAQSGRSAPTSVPAGEHAAAPPSTVARVS